MITMAAKWVAHDVHIPSSPRGTWNPCMYYLSYCYFNDFLDTLVIGFIHKLIDLSFVHEIIGKCIKLRLIFATFKSGLLDEGYAHLGLDIVT